MPVQMKISQYKDIHQRLAVVVLGSQRIATLVGCRGGCCCSLPLPEAALATALRDGPSLSSKLTVLLAMFTMLCT